MNKETNKWEEEFNKEFLRFFQSKGAGSEYVGIKQFIKNLLKEQEAPMGVSQWRELGKKYGYDKYFEEKIKKDLIKIADEGEYEAPMGVSHESYFDEDLRRECEMYFKELK